MLRNSFWVIFGSIVSRGLNFLSITVVARMLGPGDFGEFNVLQTTFGMLGTMSGLGLGLAATKLISEWRELDIQKAIRITDTLNALTLLISSVVTLVVFLSSDWIAESLLYNRSLANILRLTSILVIFDSLIGVQNGVLSGFEAFKEQAKINAVIGIISAPILVLGTVIGNLTGLMLMILTSKVFMIITNNYYLNKSFHPYKLKKIPRIYKFEFSQIIKISLPAYLGGLINSPVSWFSTTIIANQPNGYSEIGTFNAANQLRTLVMFLPDSVGKVTIPSLSNAFSNQKKNEFRTIALKTFSLNLVTSILTGIFLLVFINPFMAILGTEYHLNLALIAIVLLTAVLVALTNAIGYIFICTNKIWIDFIFRVFWGITLIATLLLFQKENGAMGYSISILFGFITYFILQVGYLIFNKNKLI